MALTLGKHAAQVSGCDIHYVELGAGPVLLFLHGSGGLRFDEASFHSLAQDYRLLVPSMPGFDDSTTGSVSSGPEVADVLAEFIASCAGGRASVVGESFGGRIAAWLTIRHPEVVERAILAAPGGLRRSGGDRGLNMTPEEQQLRLYGRKLETQPTPAQVAQRKANVATAMRFGGPAWDEDLYQQLPAISRPVLVLWGTNDQTLAREDIDQFHERIPGSRITRLEGAPHVISATYPDQFASLVKGFLAD
jgi:4,5:9,10-diseco-3-hydroxy-5,9,17-trioxoandrosta-1(10),2-diene-4-oate hydrolase